MKADHLILGGVVVVGAAVVIMHKKNTSSAITMNWLGYQRGYTNMMKIGPEYSQGQVTDTDDIKNVNTPGNDFAGRAVNTPWVLPANPGDAMEVNAGWTADPDNYGAKVAHLWLQQAVDGSHL